MLNVKGSSGSTVKTSYVFDKKLLFTRFENIALVSTEIFSIVPLLAFAFTFNAVALSSVYTNLSKITTGMYVLVRNCSISLVRVYRYFQTYPSAVNISSVSVPDGTSVDGRPPLFERHK